MVEPLSCSGSALVGRVPGLLYAFCWLLIFLAHSGAALLTLLLHCAGYLTFSTAALFPFCLYMQRVHLPSWLDNASYASITIVKDTRGNFKKQITLLEV